MARYLFTMWDGGGSVPPELSVARKLVARGHDVRVLADPTCEAEVVAAGCSFSPWTTAPHRTSRAREHDVLRDYEAKNPLQMIDQFMHNFLAVPAPRWCADTLGVLDRHPVDALVADFSIPGSLIAGEVRGLPCAIVVPNIWMVPTPGIPPLGPGWMPARGPLGRLRDWAMRRAIAHLMGRAMPHLAAVRREHGLPPVGSTHEQMLRAERVLVLTSPVFDFTSPAMPGHVRYTGPELEDPTWCAPWSPPWPESDTRPLVAVGLSTTFQDQVPTMRRIVEALAGMDVRALVTLGEALVPGEVPARGDVVVVPSAPHSQVFPQATVVITHCGHGTAMKALSAGKPVVCMPMGRDQNDTAARIVHAEAGVRISPAATVAEIRAAVRATLDDPRLRAGAERLGRALREREGCHDPAATLEALVAPEDQRPKVTSQARSASSAAVTLGAT
jgi:MGT family glycosyltransferase